MGRKINKGIKVRDMGNGVTSIKIGWPIIAAVVVVLILLCSIM